MSDLIFFDYNATTSVDPDMVDLRYGPPVDGVGEIDVELGT